MWEVQHFCMKFCWSCSSKDTHSEESVWPVWRCGKQICIGPLPWLAAWRRWGCSCHWCLPGWLHDINTSWQGCIQEEDPEKDTMYCWYKLHASTYLGKDHPGNVSHFFSYVAHYNIAFFRQSLVGYDRVVAVGWHHFGVPCSPRLQGEMMALGKGSWILADSIRWGRVQ